MSAGDLPIGPSEHRVDVREFAAARARHQHALAVAPEADLLLHPQRRVVAHKRAAIDRIIRQRLEYLTDQRTQRLGHESLAPMGLRDPEANVRAAAALDLARGPLAHIDRAERLTVAGDRKAHRGAVPRDSAVPPDEREGVLGGVWPRWQAEPPDHLPVGEQGKQPFGFVDAPGTQDEPRGADFGRKRVQHHALRAASPQRLSEAHRPRSRRKRSAGTEKPSARMRWSEAPVHWKPHFSSTRRDAGLLTRAPAASRSRPMSVKA